MIKYKLKNQKNHKFNFIIEINYAKHNIYEKML